MSANKKLRSQEWFGDKDKMGFVHRSWMRNQGVPDDYFENRPVIGICNTWSELTPCNAHLREIAEAVKRGVLEGGGVPFEFPVMSMGETLMKPTSMLFRNLVSMDVEESIRANPLDGVVLLTGCDKTTPALLMGACSVDLPTVVVPGGPMLSGRYRGKPAGTGSFNWSIKEEQMNGRLTPEDMKEAETCLARSNGHCNTMGTASTMATMVEALGLTLPGMSAIPAVDSRKRKTAQLTGRRIVEMVWADMKLSSILTREAMENAIVVNAAVGGSTNLLIHLLAIAGRMGVELSIDDFDRIGSDVPMLLNLLPSGEYLMEDYFYAGGLPAVIKALGSRVHNGAMTVNGNTLGENCSSAVCYDHDVIAPADRPVKEKAGIVVLRGNLCPDGAVIKPSAASPKLMQHRGKAVVFESIEDYHQRIDDPRLIVDEDSVLVLKGVGPKGYPGMPEVGNIDLPKRLLAQGVKDMVRISDGRMSGTAYGTVVLHISPESNLGGAFAVVRDGDWISLDVINRSLQLELTDGEIDSRLLEWNSPEPVAIRGYAKLYLDHVQQAHLGADWDVLVGNSGSEVKRDLH